MSGYHLKLDHDHFILHTFQNNSLFADNLIIWCYIVWA
jgi:hypothetical protein